MGLEPQPLPPELPGPGDDFPPTEVPTIPADPEPVTPPLPQAAPARPVAA